jgi:hypothetical protein
LAANEPAVITPLLLVLRKIDTVAEFQLATARSALPSPFRSPMATPSGFVPVVKSTLDANEPDVTAPLLLVLRKTDTVLEL